MTGVAGHDGLATPIQRGSADLAGVRHERIQDGFLVPRKELGWYGQLLARTGAAGQLAFAGAGTEIAQYLTDKQGHKHYKQQTFAGSSSVRDARHKIGPTEYVGTDQVFRLNRIRVEAFSGISEELYELLIKGQVEEYWSRVYELRDTYPISTAASRSPPALGLWRPYRETRTLISRLGRP